MSAGTQAETARFVAATIAASDIATRRKAHAFKQDWSRCLPRSDGIKLPDCVLVSVRVPKSGSSSLSRLLRAAFADRVVFPVPSTLNVDGSRSILQHLRFVRSRTQNIVSNYRTFRLGRAFEIITERATPGDLIDGGHIDFATAKAGVGRELKMITILRDPAERCRSEYNYARLAYEKKPHLARFDAGVMPKTAARYSFDGFVDFLLERRAQYGDIACRYVGCASPAEFAAYFSRNVFLAGVLEERDKFAGRLSDLLGKPLRFPHENSTGKAAVSTITRSQRTRIEQIYSRNVLLHDWVRGHA